MFVPLKTRSVNVTYAPNTSVLVNEADLEKDLPEWDKITVYKRNAISGVTAIGKLSEHVDKLEGLEAKWSQTVGVDISVKVLQSKMLEQVYELANTKQRLVQPELLLRADLNTTLATYNAQQKVLRNFEGAPSEGTANTGFSHVKLLRDRPNPVADALYVGLAQIDQPARQRVLDMPEFKEFTGNNELRSEVFDVITYNLSRGEIPKQPWMLQEARIVLKEIAGINPAAYAQWYNDGRNVEQEGVLEQLVRERAPDPSEVRANHREPLPNLAYNVYGASQKLGTLNDRLENYDTPSYFNTGLPLVINEITKGLRSVELDSEQRKQLALVEDTVQGGSASSKGLYAQLLEVSGTAFKSITNSKGFKLYASYLPPQSNDYGVGLGRLHSVLGSQSEPAVGSGVELYAKRLATLAKLNPKEYEAAVETRVNACRTTKKPMDQKTLKYLLGLKEGLSSDLDR